MTVGRNDNAVMVAGAVPLAAGFGISRPDHVRQIIAAGADGAIVGSAFVKIIEENRSNMTRCAEVDESGEGDEESRSVRSH